MASGFHRTTLRGYRTPRRFRDAPRRPRPRRRPSPRSVDWVSALAFEAGFPIGRLCGIDAQRILRRDLRLAWHEDEDTLLDLRTAVLMLEVRA